MNNDLEPLLVTVEETGRLLGGISKPSVYKLIHSEGFPVVRLGKRTLVSVQGLQEWIRYQTEARE
jgi:excisionase family DNA binding protein